jgi:hypothetical protein
MLKRTLKTSAIANQFAIFRPLANVRAGLLMILL